MFPKTLEKWCKFQEKASWHYIEGEFYVEREVIPARQRYLKDESDQDKNDDRYPDICPNCGSASWNSLRVYCSSADCLNFDGRDK